MAKNKELIKYAGLAFQLLATLSVAFFLGYRLDEWIELAFPLFLILLPLLFLFVFLYKIVKDTSN